MKGFVACHHLRMLRHGEYQRSIISTEQIYIKAYAFLFRFCVDIQVMFVTLFSYAANGGHFGDSPEFNGFLPGERLKPRRSNLAEFNPFQPIAEHAKMKGQPILPIKLLWRNCIGNPVFHREG